jgi:hypothetical protein
MSRAEDDEIARIAAEEDRRLAQQARRAGAPMPPPTPSAPPKAPRPAAPTPLPAHRPGVVPRPPADPAMVLNRAQRVTLVRALVEAARLLRRAAEATRVSSEAHACRLSAGDLDTQIKRLSWGLTADDLQPAKARLPSAIPGRSAPP